MKKLILTLLSANILTVNSIQILACNRKDEENKDKDKNKEIAKLKEEIKNILDEKDKEIAKLKEEIKNRLAEKDKEIAKLKEEIKNILVEKDEEITKLEEEIKNILVGEDKDKDREIVKLKEEIKNLVAEKENEIAKLQEGIKNQLAEKDKEITKLEEEIKNILVNKDKEIAKLKEEIKNLLAEKDTTNFIIDFSSNYKPIVTSRGWKGTLNDPSSLQTLLGDAPDPEYSQFIKKFTDALHSAASEKSSKKFDNFLKQKTFLSFNDLVNTINAHNKNSPEISYIDVPLEVIRNQAGNPIVFEETILKVYNTLSSFFGKEYAYKILRTLAIYRQKPGEKETVNGETTYSSSAISSSITMRINETVSMKNQERKEYYDGWFTTPHMYGTFVHEFGHVIDLFHNTAYPFHEKVDTVSGLKNDYSLKSIAHNEYKKNYCLTWSETSNPCPYKYNKDYLTSAFKTSNKANNYSSDSIEYNFSQEKALKDFILSKVKNLKAPGENVTEQEQFLEYMILNIFINSDYGRSDHREIQSEGFAYWLLTPENERDKAWEIWNEFFLEYLPKIRADTPHFNDYLKPKY